MITGQWTLKGKQLDLNLMNPSEHKLKNEE